jgi:hypothetical protein
MAQTIGLRSRENHVPEASLRKMKSQCGRYVTAIRNYKPGVLQSGLQPHPVNFFGDRIIIKL